MDHLSHRHNNLVMYEFLQRSFYKLSRSTPTQVGFLRGAAKQQVSKVTSSTGSFDGPVFEAIITYRPGKQGTVGSIFAYSCIAGPTRAHLSTLATVLE